MRPVSIGERFIGDCYPCIVVAEIGLNHNGEIRLAKQLIEAAAIAGADAVKFQNYHTEDFIYDHSLNYSYQCQGKKVTESQFEMFKRCELNKNQLSELKKFSDDIGIILFSTPTGKNGIQDLVNLNVLLLKNGSDYLLHLPLIRTMAKTNIPTIISTGMAKYSEIEEAVQTFRSAGGKDLILLHCTSSYPTRAQEVNLRKIPELVNSFNCPVGFSDHTQGVVAAIGAVVLSACVVEKHFTLDKNLSGPDHRFSADPKEFHDLVVGIRTIEKSLGSSTIEPTPSEKLNRQAFRQSCVAAENIFAGQILRETDIMFCRPGTGLPPKQALQLIGSRIERSVKKGHIFMLEDFS
jgi:N-acetylneuraminate synthase/N,N'-diacetyllegionaminate synthase